MKIAVCVKYIPDLQSERRIEDGRMVRGEDDTLNELDENAIEAAVSLVEKHGGEVVAFSMGPEDAEDAVMRALQMGADRGVLITDEQLAGSDVYATASVLSAAILSHEAEAPFDLVVTGMASFDGMTFMLPAALATYLGRPYMGLAKETEVTSNLVRITRESDGYLDQLEAPFPAVISVTDQANDPRYPNFKAMAAARKKPLEVWDLDELLGRVAQANASFELGPVGAQSSGTNILDVSVLPERENRVVVTDTGDGGKKLAEYIAQVVSR
ncbi:electron transfer flavoprotein subunit beta/FixA family protein [Boudabousia marimammalium]|uniref:Electron transfer flavoprotein subunit beta n=1 Tax=Boudabousia marimammalium TaxID=156892 RepID=A0A1Q5PRM6_9ACTO|nr:electron transfer flavoprotein subunit beta/FixA family protein [Boudabousia marimammalium]OKL50149.1 electron transfer flavoprotein subunit beta [Boudabousia marimammalium]